MPSHCEPTAAISPAALETADPLVPKVVLYVATSLDGFIADRDGGVDWLFHDGDYGYSDFLAGIEALIMGRKTYEQVLSFGEWPYGDKAAYVYTRSAPQGEHPHVEFVSADVTAFVADLRARCSQDIWLVGGAELTAAFRAQGLIDRYVLSVHPVLLGEGISLFEGRQPRAELRLEGSKSYDSGLVQLVYATS
jgi:dihydrofolate reductase